MIFEIDREYLDLNISWSKGINNFGIFKDYGCYVWIGDNSNYLMYFGTDLKQTSIECITDYKSGTRNSIAIENELKNNYNVASNKRSSDTPFYKLVRALFKFK